MRNPDRELTIMFVACWLVVLAVLGYVRSCAGMPLVQKSWPDEECVAVWSPDPAHSCDNLPERYELEWVAPR